MSRSEPGDFLAPAAPTAPGAQNPEDLHKTYNLPSSVAAVCTLCSGRCRTGSTIATAVHQKTTDKEMIMSTQLRAVGGAAPGPIGVLAHSVRARVISVIEHLIATKQARAEHEVRAVMASFSAERLAEFGWHPEDIRRLKSR